MCLAIPKRFVHKWSRGKNDIPGLRDDKELSAEDITVFSWVNN